jgi:hypothetical protein
LGSPIFNHAVATTERSVVLGLDSVRLFAVVDPNGVAAGEPTAEVDIGAPARTKWLKLLNRRPVAVRTRLHPTTLHWIAHAANIGTARRKKRGHWPPSANLDRFAPLGLRCGVRSLARVAAAIR